MTPDLLRTLAEMGVKFEAGQGIKARDLQALANKIDELVEKVNFLQTNFYDLNLEVVNGMSQSYTLESAIAAVPQTRRKEGMKIRFKTESGLFAEYSYVGSGIGNEFTAPENWIGGVDTVDGGVF